MSNKVKIGAVEESEISRKVLKELRFPSSTPRYQIPLDETIEQELSNVEHLIDKGYFGRALKRATEIKVTESPLKQHYQFMLQQKISKANIRIAEHYQGIDILANIAGGFIMGETVHETSDKTWDFLFNLNTLRTF